MHSARAIVACCSLPLMLTLAGCGADHDGFDRVDVGESVETTHTELAIRSGNLWPPLWTGLTRVQVCFTNGTPAQRANVQRVAESSWEAIAADVTGLNGRYGVDFSGFGACPASTAGMIPITFNSTGTDETLGLGRAVQRMDLSVWASDTAIIHEFGHALGYTHEFLRSDYAAVDPDCTATRGTKPDLGITPVDPLSVMNYDQCGRIGSLTTLDIIAHRSLYGPWNVNYGSILAMRHDPSWNYVRGYSTPDTMMSGILADREFTLVNVSNPSSTGQLNFGDSVRIRTHNGQFLKSNGASALVTKTSAISGATTWRVFGRITSGPVRVNDEVLFKASDLNYLRSNSSQQLTTGVGQFFRLAHLLSSLNLSG